MAPQRRRSVPPRGPRDVPPRGHLHRRSPDLRRPDFRFGRIVFDRIVVDDGHYVGGGQGVRAVPRLRGDQEPLPPPMERRGRRGRGGRDQRRHDERRQVRESGE